MGGTEPGRNDEGSSWWDLAHKFNMAVITTVPLLYVEKAAANPVLVHGVPRRPRPDLERGGGPVRRVMVMSCCFPSAP